MKAKWYIGTFIFIFTFLGVANYNQIPEPNQEIVLQFTHLKISSNEVQNAIAIIKKQLQAIGVDTIEVEEQVSGGLKITYYSDTDAASVKKILSEEHVLVLDDTASKTTKKPVKLPSNKKQSHYNLDVFEIHKQDAETGFAGKCALELKTDYNRFFIPNISVLTNEIDVKTIDCLVKEAYKFRKNSAIVIDNTSYKIPEVRAGPFC